MFYKLVKVKTTEPWSNKLSTKTYKTYGLLSLHTTADLSHVFLMSDAINLIFSDITYFMWRNILSPVQELSQIRFWFWLFQEKKKTQVDHPTDTNNTTIISESEWKRYYLLAEDQYESIWIASGITVRKMITTDKMEKEQSVVNDEKLHEILELICSPIYFTPVPQTRIDRHLIASKDFAFFQTRFLWVLENSFFSPVQISVWNPWSCLKLKLKLKITVLHAWCNIFAVKNTISIIDIYAESYIQYTSFLKTIK